MTTVRTLTSVEVSRAIRAAFEDAGPCDCHTVVKLGEGELMDYLLAHAVIQPEHASGVALLEIAALERYRRRDLFTHRTDWSLRRADIRSLNDFRGWTFADLLKLPEMSVPAAKKLEEVLAEFGILLEGGDPVLLEKHRMEPEPVLTDGPPPDGTPEQIRQRATDSLFEIASKIIDDGMSLTKLASKVISRGDHTGRLKNYIKLGQMGAADVARIAAPVFAIEALEKERPSSKGPSKAKRVRESRPKAALMNRDYRDSLVAMAAKNNVVQLSA